MSKVDLDYSLDDKYLLDEGRVFLSGTQALVKLPLIQKKIDELNNLNTAGFISGYPGSPLGGYDHALHQASNFLKDKQIVFQPGINEDLAATALHGTQQTTLVDNPKHDGVFGIWFGKGPGVDRSGDALKHGNYAGSSKHGGVLALAGDDHAAKSSTTAHQSDHAFIHFGMPILNPATVQDYIDFGLMGIAMSRYSGCWIGMKCITDTVESAASVDIGLKRFKPVLPDISDEEGDLHLQWGYMPAMSESRLYKQRLPAAQAFARANSIDRVIFQGQKKLAIVTSGKAYLDVRQSLDELGLSEKLCSKIGISLYKVGMVWPLEPKNIFNFVNGNEEVLVVEEKRPIVEDQLMKYLYNEKDRPLIIGKKDEFGNDLVPSEGELSPSQIALIIAKRIKGLSLNIELESKVEEIETLLGNINSAPVSDLFRLPSFCAGCPHNTSTKVPDDSFAFGGIGCHGMATFMPERKTYNLGQMGGEGVMWTGIAPFTETDHIFQNLGDGTYYHSGILALRAAIASKANITFKILVNDAIAMTGGQEISGKVQVDNLSWQVHSEGAKKVVVMTDYPEKYPANSSFAPGVKIYQRDELDKVQRELREIKGVTVILYDQYCATELRRRRKRGLAEEPDKRIFINPLVCEGCGDCGVQSNCIAIEPHESKFGRKREINQSACNKDYSCTKGYCPSFLTVTGGTLKKKGNIHRQNENPKYQNEDLPTPVVCDLNKPFNILLTGIGGSGVITLGAIIGTAAHLENKGASTLDVAGLAQRNGPVTSHLRVANSPSDLHSTRIASGSADLIIGCDIVVTTGIESISKINKKHTNMVINSHVAPTSNFASNPDLDLSSARMIKGLKEIASPELMHIVNATKFATSLMGNSIAANLFLVGYAIQKGLFPISLSAIERAIELNGVSIDMNKESIYWGRLAAVDIKKLETITSADNKSIDYSESLSSMIDDRYNFLISYQNIKYAEKYKSLIHKIIKIDESIHNNRDDLSIAAAKFYFKLMAYKDEYEVARLHTGHDIKKYLDDKLEGDYKIEYSLAPPVFGGRDKITGRYPKRKLPSFTYYLFAIMKHFKFLRGTSFDVFGMSTHRKIERGLISEYESMLAEIETNINIENYDAAVKIALLPDHIKGYDVVKESNIEKSKLLKEQYFNEFYGKNIEVVNKYPKAIGG